MLIYLLTCYNISKIDHNLLLQNLLYYLASLNKHQENARLYPNSNQPELVFLAKKKE